MLATLSESHTHCDPPFTNPSDMLIGAKRGAQFANKKA
jgi:hypothetical protein